MDVLALAADEFGLVSTAAVRRAGFSGDALHRRVRDGTLHRVARGWYSLTKPADADAARVLRIRACLREFDGRVVASHQSAVALLGLPLYRSSLDAVHLMRVADTHSRRRPGVVLHQQLLNGPPVTKHSVAPEVAVVQIGLSRGPESALIAADAAVRRGFTTPSAIDDVVGLMTRHRGIGPVRSVLTLVDGRAESPGESRTRLLLHHLGLVARPQVVIKDGSFVARVDFLLERFPVIVEFDGKVKYADRADLMDEKAREDRLRELGYEVVRLTWSDLDQVDRARQKITRAIERSSARRAR